MTESIWPYTREPPKPRPYVLEIARIWHSEADNWESAVCSMTSEEIEAAVARTGVEKNKTPTGWSLDFTGDGYEDTSDVEVTLYAHFDRPAEEIQAETELYEKRMAQWRINKAQQDERDKQSEIANIERRIFEYEIRLRELRGDTDG